MNDANTIAKAILSFVDPDLEVISNLKLQKLLYYVQGFNLAAFKEPLFKEKIVAWQYGPVVREVYDEYKTAGASQIVLVDPNFKPKSVFKSKEQFQLFKDVYRVYSQFSALKLMHMTHSEPPWKNTKINYEISHKLMREYFKTRLAND
jgi:uncharacterized phage-associated protein